MSKGRKFCHYLWNYLGSICCWNGSKTLLDVSKSMDKTYETVERSKKSGQFKQ